MPMKPIKTLLKGMMMRMMPLMAILRHELRTLCGSWLVRLWLIGTIVLTLLLLAGQMLGTVTPLVLFPDVTWAGFLVPTLEGQYILKNVVLATAGIVIGATVRGGRLIDDPEVVEYAVRV